MIGLRPVGLLPPIMAQSKDPPEGSPSGTDPVSSSSSSSGGEHNPTHDPPPAPRRTRNSLRGSSSSFPWLPTTWESAAQMALRVAFNVATFFLLMRIWPMGSWLRGGDESPGGSAKEVSVKLEVPFSDFVRNVKENEVGVTVISRIVS